MSSVSRFAEKTRDELKARPILPFGAPVRIGSIGVVEGDQFSPRGTVQSILGSEVGEVVTGTRADWQLTSGRDVHLNFVAKGNASALFPSAPKADAKIEVSFGSSDSFLVDIAGLKVSTLADPALLLDRMLQAYARGTWRKDYVLVYETVEPEQALVLLSKASDSKFLLSAKADVVAPQGTAKVAGRFGLSFQTKDALHLESSAQPLLFNAFRVKEDFWTGGLAAVPLGAKDITAGVFVPV